MPTLFDKMKCTKRSYSRSRRGKAQMTTQLEQNFDKLSASVTQACELIDQLRAERDALRHALQALYDASPTSCDDDYLNEAQRLAEGILSK